MTVWIYVDTSKEVGDIDHFKVFANEDAAETWLLSGDGVNRVGRRTIMCMLLIPALAVIWNTLGH